MIEVAMPRLGESVDSGVVTRWLRADGDWIDEGSDLYEVATDKVDMTIESIGSGYLVRLVDEDTECAVGAVIARLVDDWPEPPSERV